MFNVIIIQLQYNQCLHNCLSAAAQTASMCLCWPVQENEANKLVGVAQGITSLPPQEPTVSMWETGVRFLVKVPRLCYTNKSPWARLLTLHWPTCNTINLVSRSG